MTWMQENKLRQITDVVFLQLSIESLWYNFLREHFPVPPSVQLWENYNYVNFGSIVEKQLFHVKEKICDLVS